MMRRICYSLLACLVFADPAPASDLAAIDRTIRKEPAYQSKNPQYCLLVFGPKAETRVWVVLDGDVLYLDRNGNGNLTDPDERIAAETALHRPENRADVEVLRIFELRGWDKATAPIVSGGPDVTWFYVMQLIPREDWHDRRWAKFWNDKPFDVAVNTRTGPDQRARVKFAERAQDAPILHYDGPRQLAVNDHSGPLVFRRGETSELILFLSTPGLNSYVRTDHGHIPEDIHPVVELELPPASAGEESIRLRFELKDRC